MLDREWTLSAIDSQTISCHVLDTKHVILLTSMMGSRIRQVEIVSSAAHLLAFGTGCQVVTIIESGSGI